MFWRVSGLNTASPVDSILDKDNFTLEELLDEDELIQECKSLNARLTAFLKKKETVQRLLQYLVETPAGSDDPKRHFKYPFAACEIFCCEVEGIFNTLLENESLLDQLFSILQNERPLNCMLAGYFSRVVGSLLLRRTQEVMQYLQRHPELLDRMVEHVDTTSVAEVLVRLVGADEQRACLANSQLQWLSETNLLYQLLGKLAPDQLVEAQNNAAEILAAIAQSQVSPLTRNLASPEFIEQLFQRALAPEGGVVTHALNVCIALLEPLPQEQQLPPSQLAAADAPSADTQAKVKQQAIRCISGSVDQLVAMLDDAPPGALETTFGVVSPPMGSSRLKAVELLAVLMRTGDATAEAAVMGTPAVQKCMELFLAYPFNNALHRHVTALLLAFDSGSDAVVDFLLRDCKLLSWLTSAPDQVTPTPREGDARGGQRRPWRAGYTGHLTRLANKLVQVAAARPKLDGYLKAADSWQQYVADTLNPRNALENTNAWQCGRPSSHEPVIEADGELFQTEMDFGSINESFSRDVYQRYGAFNAENDEDEEVAPEWAMDLASGGGAGSNPGVPGKLHPPAPVPFDAFDDHSSSSSDSDDEGRAISPRSGSSSSPDMEVSVAPAPGPDGDILMVSSGAMLAQRSGSSAEDEMSDMMNDAVMLEFEAAEQLVELQRQLEQQLTLAEGAGAADGVDAGGAGSREAEGGAGPALAAPAGELQGAAGQHENGGFKVVPSEAAAAEAAPPPHANGQLHATGKESGRSGEEEVPAEFNSANFWKANFEVDISDELQS
ncbi:hypothetical protein N2152v2_001791 [Parachlorella kessleri]